MLLNFFCMVRDPRRCLGERMLSLISEAILNKASLSVWSFVISFAFDVCVSAFLATEHLLGRT